MRHDPELGRILQGPFPGCHVDACRELGGGVSARAVVVDLTLACGTAKQVVVRRPTRYTPEAARRTAEREGRVLRHCAARGLRTPRPFAVDSEAAAVVLEYVAGAPDLSLQNAPSMLVPMADELARIHRLGPPDGPPLLERHADRTGQAIRKTPRHLDLALDEPRVRAVLTRVWPFPQHNPDTLLHGDYWPGNLLWSSNELVAVLDWAVAAIGDPLADVAIARLDILWVFGERAMHAFTRRYREQTKLDWRNLALWDLCVALRPMSNLSRWAPGYARPPMCRPDVTERTMTQGHHHFVRQALRTLELELL